MTMRTKTVSDKVWVALDKAIKRAEERAVQFETTGKFDPKRKADMAIKNHRQDRILSREELDRPMTI